MNRYFICFLSILAAAAALCAGVPRVFAADTGDAGGATASAPANAQEAINTRVAAAVAAGHEPMMPDFIEDLADSLLELFNIQNTGNSWERYALATGVLVFFFLLRRLVLPLLFRFLRKATGRIMYGWEGKIFSAVEAPVAFMLMICGVYVAIRMLKYSPEVADVVHGAAKLLFAVAFLWIVTRAIGAIIDYLHDKARTRESYIAAFMPWIRKSIVGIVFVVGVLVIAQNFGMNVQTFLAGLGIGGLAFALAAQDTLANIFGAAVIAADQPFRVGDTVQLAGHTGMVEDIGIRSMKLRRADKALVVIPNKTVASESIVNLSKLTCRRVEQVLAFTHGSEPRQLEAIVRDLKALIEAQKEVQASSVMVYFRDFNASSLDLWIAYETKDPDFKNHMELRQRLNLEFMRAAAAGGLSFALPARTIDLAPSAARALGKS
jgi:MscS family membrane protein